MAQKKPAMNLMSLLTGYMQGNQGMNQYRNQLAQQDFENQLRIAALAPKPEPPGIPMDIQAKALGIIQRAKTDPEYAKNLGNDQEALMILAQAQQGKTVAGLDVPTPPKPVGVGATERLINPQTGQEIARGLGRPQLPATESTQGYYDPNTGGFVQSPFYDPTRGGTRTPGGGGGTDEMNKLRDDLSRDIARGLGLDSPMAKWTDEQGQKFFRAFTTALDYTQQGMDYQRALNAAVEEANQAFAGQQGSLGKPSKKTEQILNRYVGPQK